MAILSERLYKLDERTTERPINVCPFDAEQLAERLHVAEYILRACLNIQQAAHCHFDRREKSWMMHRQRPRFLPTVSLCDHYVNEMTDQSLFEYSGSKAACKKIREQEQRLQLESYISAHFETNFSHGACTNCYKKFFKRVAAA